MAGPKRHHHLAQAVQRNFLENGATKLWWYSRSSGKYEERVPRSIAHAKNTYTFTAISGKDRYALEEALSKLESRAIPALRRLSEGSDISQGEHNAISEFAAFQFLRTPSKLSLIQHMLNVGVKAGIEARPLRPIK